MALTNIVILSTMTKNEQKMHLHFNNYFSLKSTVCLMLCLMFGNGMHAVLFVHCKLLLRKELVLPYQVTLTRRETEIQRKRKRTCEIYQFPCQIFLFLFRFHFRFFRFCFRFR